VLAVVGSSPSPPAARGRADPRREARRQAARRLPHAARRALSCPARREGIAAFRTPEACRRRLCRPTFHGARRAAREEAEIPYPLFDYPFELFAPWGFRSSSRRSPARLTLRIRFLPVAVKVMDADHRPRPGGVALGIAAASSSKPAPGSSAGISSSCRGWSAGLAEAIVGYRDDPVVGPTCWSAPAARWRSCTRICG